MGGRVKPGRRGEQLALALVDVEGNVAAKAKKPRKRRHGVALGRKPSPERIGFVPHVARIVHDARHPVHVSMRRTKLAPSLRNERVYRAILEQLARAKRQRVRVVHFSVQHDHLHLIVEGQDRLDLSNQMCKLFSRIARAVNSIAKRRGCLFRDRHHRRELASPTQTRNALVYVLFNDRKHEAQGGGPISERMLHELDDRTSVGWIPLADWAESARPPPDTLARLRARNLVTATGAGSETPISTAGTWLAQRGWFEHGGGRMRIDELPRFLPRSRRSR